MQPSSSKRCSRASCVTCAMTTRGLCAYSSLTPSSSAQPPHSTSSQDTLVAPRWSLAPAGIEEIPSITKPPNAMTSWVIGDTCDKSVSFLHLEGHLLGAIGAAKAWGSTGHLRSARPLSVSMAGPGCRKHPGLIFIQLGRLGKDTKGDLLGGKKDQKRFFINSIGGQYYG
jgi:hypothetical protein